MARRRSRSRTAAKFMVECLHTLLHLLAALILWEHSKEESKPARRQTGSGGGGGGALLCCLSGGKVIRSPGARYYQREARDKRKAGLDGLCRCYSTEAIPLSLFYRSPDLESYQIANNPTGWRWRYVRR
jgi:hypothetical protein